MMNINDFHFHLNILINQWLDEKIIIDPKKPLLVDPINDSFTFPYEIWFKGDIYRTVYFYIEVYNYNKAKQDYPHVQLFWYDDGNINNPITSYFRKHQMEKHNQLKLQIENLLKNNKIKCQGDYWHCNPKIFNPHLNV